MNYTLIELRTDRTNQLIGRLEPDTLRLHIHYRGEQCTFDLPAIVRSTESIARPIGDRKTAKQQGRPI